MERNKKLRIIIIVLAVLLSISVAALTGTLLYNHFLHAESSTVDVPGNIITPDSAESTDADTDENNSLQASAPEAAPAGPSVSQSAESESVSGTKASALSLHTKQPEENTPFQVTNMFPGDVETKYYRVKVSYKGDIVVRYHADIRPGYEKLAEVLNVRIRLSDSDVFLYDGLMRDMPKSLNHALYTAQSTQSEIYYEITAYLDTSVGNEYQNKELIADFRWWVEEVDNLDPPKTGSTTNIHLWTALAVGSFFCLLILLAKRRKEAVDDAE